MKHFLISFATLLLLLVIPSPVSAQAENPASGPYDQLYNESSGDPRSGPNDLVEKELQDPSTIFKQVNPVPNLSSPSEIINKLLPTLLIIAGLILFFMLISGGFTIMTAAQNPEQADMGKKRITTAVVGFVVIFAAYWLAQILEIIFGITILG